MIINWINRQMTSKPFTFLTNGQPSSNVQPYTAHCVKPDDILGEIHHTALSLNQP